MSKEEFRFVFGYLLPYFRSRSTTFADMSVCTSSQYVISQCYKMIPDHLELSKKDHSERHDQSNDPEVWTKASSAVGVYASIRALGIDRD